MTGRQHSLISTSMWSWTYDVIGEAECCHAGLLGGYGSVRMIDRGEALVVE
ncbi:hypothetical protein KEM60_02469 [Austwickia sp. TVS 96-490-7B]|uniref:hypothetical protein n=1 Tax=Austwickia sp. TVS 96-490-7B TaxID=2830843 RepID=UPI001C55EC87|nr:hypothetical protein [Austwickia sp. TVS 96-490-7B]MBW3086258.1 hypothetical protein [Austwickia sp. TVS 96-490-7B]